MKLKALYTDSEAEIERLIRELEAVNARIDELGDPGALDAFVVIGFLLILINIGVLVYLLIRQRKLSNLMSLQQQQLSKTAEEKKKIKKLEDEITRNKRSIRELEKELKEAPAMASTSADQNTLEELKADFQEFREEHRQIRQELSELHRHYTQIPPNPTNSAQDTEEEKTSFSEEPSHFPDKPQPSAEASTEELTDFRSDDEDRQTEQVADSEPQTVPAGADAENPVSDAPEPVPNSDDFRAEDSPAKSPAIGEEIPLHQIAAKEAAAGADSAEEPETRNAESEGPENEEATLNDLFSQPEPDGNPPAPEGANEEASQADESVSKANTPEPEPRPSGGGFGLKAAGQSSDASAGAVPEPQAEDAPEETSGEREATEPEPATPAVPEAGALQITNVQSPDHYEQIPDQERDEYTRILYALSLINRAVDSGKSTDIIQANQILNPLKDSSSGQAGLAAQIHAEGLAAMADINGQPLLYTRAVAQFKKVAGMQGIDAHRLNSRWAICLIKTGLATEKHAYIEQAGSILEQLSPEDGETGLAILIADYLINQTPPEENPDIGILKENWPQDTLTNLITHWNKWEGLEPLLNTIRQ